MQAFQPVSNSDAPLTDVEIVISSYFEGIPPVQIARALGRDVQAILDMLRSEPVLRSIRQYEECLERQARFCTLAARTPAIATLREICTASEGSLAERRRAASDLLRSSREFEKPARPHDRLTNRRSAASTTTAAPDKAHETALESPSSHPPTPIATFSPEAHAFTAQQSAAPSNNFTTHASEPGASTSAPLQTPTASWHAFASEEAHTRADSSHPIEPFHPAASPTITNTPPPPDIIPSPYDNICPRTSIPVAA